ncbi:hypothetical protein Fmac_011980 [Flemingia macrophylla]|uniref:Uncharacterized protein n=1 Tax=Flemingia macrophylla TaxID=520843 RepID=A0ABD1MP13_9FABA
MSLVDITMDTTSSFLNIHINLLESGDPSHALVSPFLEGLGGASTEHSPSWRGHDKYSLARRGVDKTLTVLERA